MLVESLRFIGQIPSEGLGMFPSMKVLFINAESSYGLKNRSVEATTGDWVDIDDTDCISQGSWLQALPAAISEYPDASAVTARARYPGWSRMEPVLGLLPRFYLDPGRCGSTRSISGNAASFRREVFRRRSRSLRDTRIP